MKLKTKMWIALIGTALVLLALGGWAVDALRWPFANARNQWRLALSPRGAPLRQTDTATA